MNNSFSILNSNNDENHIFKFKDSLQITKFVEILIKYEINYDIATEGKWFKTYIVSTDIPDHIPAVNNRTLQEVYQWVTNTFKKKRFKKLSAFLNNFLNFKTIVFILILVVILGGVFATKEIVNIFQEASVIEKFKIISEPGEYLKSEILDTTSIPLSDKEVVDVQTDVNMPISFDLVFGVLSTLLFFVSMLLVYLYKDVIFASFNKIRNGLNVLRKN